MELNLQQRVCIKFCVKNGFNGATTLKMLEKSFGNDTLKKTVVYQWHERFRSGRESVNDDERSGRPSTSKTDENIDKIKDWMTVDRKLTIREMAEELDIAFGSVQKRFAKKDLICGQTTRGSCTTITHRRTMPSLSVNIWLKTERIPFNNHRILLTWLPATFSYSVDSRNRSVEHVSAPGMKSWKNRRWL